MWKSATFQRRVLLFTGKFIVIDGRSHICGNSYCEVEPETKIEYHKYGFYGLILTSRILHDA